MGKHVAPSSPLNVTVEEILDTPGWILPTPPAHVTPEAARRVLRHVFGNVHPPFMGDRYEHFTAALRHAAEFFEVEGWDV